MAATTEAIVTCIACAAPLYSLSPRGHHPTPTTAHTQQKQSKLPAVQVNKLAGFESDPLNDLRTSCGLIVVMDASKSGKAG